MMKPASYILPENHPWHDYIHIFDTLPSTNDYAKALAIQGAPEGTVVIAGAQSAGRGRLGRSFYAVRDLGMYLSVILRPGCAPQKLMHLTCAAAVAVCNGIQQCTGIRPQIKWINDLILNEKKLGGILTELSVNSNSQLVDWAVVGIGINCLHRSEDFPPEIQDVATSLLLSGGDSPLPADLAGAVIPAIDLMNQQLFTEKEKIIDTYRKDCITVGKDVWLMQGDSQKYVTVFDIDQSGGLVVRDDRGQETTVLSGEVSIRGKCGYL